MMVLFEDGPWRLISGGKFSCADIQHRCPTEQGTKNEWWYYAGYWKCGVCEEFIPDEMRGLKLLQDWER